MTQHEFFELNLPKWPALLVVGKPVTREQAMEIILRTDDLHFSSNDHSFDKLLNEYFYEIEIADSSYGGSSKAIAKKLNIEEKEYKLIWDYEEQKNSEIKSLNLSYLQNSRIVSSWIGGAHGWCDWNGNIGTSNYNIGKWPSVEEVYNDWVQIAEAFPFLELTSQLQNSEVGEDDVIAVPVVEYRIKDGKVEMYDPTELITESKFDDEAMIKKFTDPYSERGCTVEMFREAVDYVRNKFKKELEDVKD
jgi:hypothetical protein